MAWPATASYRSPDTAWQRLGAALGALGRLVLPVLLLVSTLAVCYVYLDTKLTLLADSAGRWLSLGQALLPSTFFAVALTNRRYGPAYAFAQVVLAMLAIAGAVTLEWNSLRGLLPLHAEPTTRFVASFGAAFFLASFVSIVLFDGARGPRWWTAPLFGLMGPAFVFAAIFFPAAYAGLGDAAWVAHMFAFFGLMLGAAVLSLAPYWVLRGVVPPLSGFGGY
jgi:uncharacterized PurR-regulated membrane protein YhhQ (DUF165 family)